MTDKQRLINALSGMAIAAIGEAYKARDLGHNESWGKYLVQARAFIDANKVVKEILGDGNND